MIPLEQEPVAPEQLDEGVADEGDDLDQVSLLSCRSGDSVESEEFMCAGASEPVPMLRSAWVLERQIAVQAASQVASEALAQVSGRTNSVIDDFYTVHGQIIGEGNFGKVRKAFVKITGAARAVKSIEKALTRTKTGAAKQEVAVMNMVDHPNLVVLFEIFEDESNQCLVMELCSGGHLLDLIEGSENAGLSEHDSAVAMQQILRAISYMHGLKICHRDIKADNCLMTRPSLQEDSLLKVCDFGLSKVFKPNEVFLGRVGTPTHWAPEVLDRRYTKDVDMWACGVVLYQMLAGKVPFSDENDCEEIREGSLSFEEEVWQGTSEALEGLLRRLMDRDVQSRASPLGALRSPWFKQLDLQNHQARFTTKQLRRLKTFRSLSKLKRAALTAMYALLGEKEIGAGRRLFVSLDRNGDGLLSQAELEARLSRSSRASSKSGLAESIFRERRDQAEADFKPFSYTEFMVATLSRKRVCFDDALCRAAFRSFDVDGDGRISLSEMGAIKSLRQLPVQELRKLFREHDLDGDGFIDFSEFVHLMRRGEG